MLSSDQFREILTDTLAAARARDYAGFSKFDALNSPLLSALSLNNKWLRLIYTQLIKQSPINFRGLLGVKTSRNPKGIALFARAYLLMHERSGDPEHLAEAETLLQWLLDNPSPDQGHLCWGYNFVWQSPIFLQAKFEPNTVVTVFVGEALLHAYKVTGKAKYLDAAANCAAFITDDLPVLHEDENERAIPYVLRAVGAVVLNNQVLTGALLAKVWRENKDDRLLEIAGKQMMYTYNRRTEYDCWYYTWPRNKSPITHDNYHTGGILDAYLEYYEATGDDRFMNGYWSGLEYYRENLFEPDFAPRWMNDKQYPYDVHGSAQGIITFAKAARHDGKYLETATGISEWACSNLYRPGTSDFIYRQGRLMKWNYCLMRWCNGWMTRALAELETASEG